MNLLKKKWIDAYPARPANLLSRLCEEGWQIGMYDRSVVRRNPEGSRPLDLSFRSGIIWWILVFSCRKPVKDTCFFNIFTALILNE
ncbi:MAG: hypothetical protein IIA61_13020 [Candidatus Marinimicrobia bacterium]|nr:hypothetical protein [Candidatus Neomarinimicrobiota bacterium]